MKTHSILFTLFLFSNKSFGAVHVGEDPGNRREREILDAILNNSSYDARIRPGGAEGPDMGGSLHGPAVTAAVNMYVRSIHAVDEVNQDYRLRLTFRMQWEDKRLAFRHLLPDNGTRGPPYISLAKSDHTEMWMPDVFFSNEIDGHLHSLIGPNSYFRISPDGSILYSARLSLTLFCGMDFRLFPFDKQTCSLRLASYAYTTAHIIFQWKKDNPVQMTPYLHLNQFTLRQYSTDYCDSHTVTGVYSCLRADFLFKREFKHYLIKMFIPSTMFVIIAYMALWIRNSGVTISFVTVVTLTLGTMATEGSRPLVSYTTAIDVWLGVCLTFVLSSFLLCVLSKVMSKKVVEPVQSDLEEVELRPLWTTSMTLTQTYETLPLGEKVMFVARLAYPILFLLFIIVYTASYYSPETLHPDVPPEEYGTGTGKMTKYFSS